MEMQDTDRLDFTFQLMAMMMLIFSLCVMMSESGLERGASGMQGAPRMLPAGATAQREEHFQGEDSQHHLSKSVLHY